MKSKHLSLAASCPPQGAPAELQPREVKAVCTAGAVLHPPQTSPSPGPIEASVGGCTLSETAGPGESSQSRTVFFPCQLSAESQPSQALCSGGDTPILSAAFLRGLSRGTTLQTAWDPGSQLQTWSPSAVHLSQLGPGRSWSPAQGHQPRPPPPVSSPHPHGLEKLGSTCWEPLQVLKPLLLRAPL